MHILILTGLLVIKIEEEKKNKEISWSKLFYYVLYIYKRAPFT